MTFSVKVEREIDGAMKRIAETVEKRPKVDFYRCLSTRIAKLWRENPERLLELGIIRKGD